MRKRLEEMPEAGGVRGCLFCGIQHFDSLACVKVAAVARAAGGHARGRWVRGCILSLRTVPTCPLGYPAEVERMLGEVEAEKQRRQGGQAAQQQQQQP